MKDAYYFSHDSNAKDDPKCVMLIEKLGMEGYGIFWALVETLREQPEYKYPLRLIPALARRYNTTAEIIQSVINDFGLFEIEDECFFSPSLMRRMKKWNDYREQQRAKAMKRWDRNADAKPSQSHCNTMDNPCKYDGKATVILRKEKKRKEKKEEEKKEDIVCAEQAPAPPPEPPVISLPLNDKTEYPITQTQVDEWRELYPAVDVMQELRKYVGWAKSNPTKRKTRRGILRSVTSWLSKEQDRGGARASPNRKKLDGLKYDQRPPGENGLDKDFDDMPSKKGG
jgi:hypothetical protein